MTPQTDNEIIERREADRLNARILADSLSYRDAVLRALPVDDDADRRVAAALNAYLSKRSARKLTRKP